mgnify:FL=1
MNIEELARQAGAGGEFWLGIETPPGYFDSLPIFERFADLVLEQAAQKCENHPDGLNMIGGAFVICAEAIRAMKPTQGE